MAQRRMFSLAVIDTDKFNDLSLSARLLYYELGMRADDDGFIASPKKILKMVGCSEDDLTLLIIKGFLICFESGVIVITHWKIHNYIKTDRYRKSIYQDEFSKLNLENNIYSLIDVSNLEPLWIQNGSKMDTQDRLGKDRLNNIVGQDPTSYNSEINEIIDYLNLKLGTHYKPDTKSTQKHIKSRFNEGYTVDDFKKVIDRKTEEWKSTEMSKYLRPDTLFGTKFESYLNAPSVYIPDNTDTFRGYDILN